MLRNGDYCGLAVRKSDGGIYAERMPWVSLATRGFLVWPFVRGFPILLETLINGVKSFNRSVSLAEEESGGSCAVRTTLSLILAIVVAAALFVFAPHLLSMLMHSLKLGADVDGFSFHIWDGFFKCAIFLAYIYFIAFFPDIRRIYEYHGAEHMTIGAWESGEVVSARSASRWSRLHPRCGSTFVLVVICVSLLVQAALIPVFLKIWTPANPAAKHVLTIFYKLALVVPVSALAYEAIRFGANLPRGRLSFILQSPGLALQRLTTREPDSEQLEVAVVALNEALGADGADETMPVAYSRVNNLDYTEK